MSLFSTASFTVVDPTSMPIWKGHASAAALASAEVWAVSTVVTRGAQEAHAADASSFAEVEASVMISVYLLFLAFFFIGLLPTYSSMDSPGLINRRRMAMRAIVSEDSGQPRSIQWAMMPR